MDKCDCFVKECKKHDNYKKDDDCKKENDYKKHDDDKKEECKCEKIFEDVLDDLLII